MSVNNRFSIILSEKHIQEIPHQPAKVIISKLNRDFQDLFQSEWKDVLPITSKQDLSPEYKLRRVCSLNKLSSWAEKSFPNDKIVKFNKSFRIERSGEVIARFIEGEGIRNKSGGGGHAGKKFEDDLSDTINGKTSTHRNIVDILKNNSNLDWSNVSSTTEGSKNQKRCFQWDGRNVIMTPSGDIGNIVTDVNISDGNNTEHLSLKWGSHFFLANLSMRELLDLSNKDTSEKRDSWLRWIGFNPQKFCSPYGLGSSINTIDNHSRVCRRWEKILQQIIGYGYTYVVGGIEKPKVIKLDTWSSVKVYKVIERVYAEQGVRKSSRIRLLVNLLGEDRIIDVQFRGTEVYETLPNYMRILLTKNSVRQYQDDLV